MQEDLIEALRRSVRGVLEPLFGERPEVGAATSDWCDLFRSNMTGAVGLAGSRSGVVALHASRTSVGVLAELLTGSPHPTDEELRDTLCELANMIGGNLPMHAQGILPAVSTSLPSVIEGDNFYVRFVRSVERTLLPVRIAGVELVVDFVLSEPAVATTATTRIWALGLMAGGENVR